MSDKYTYILRERQEPSRGRNRVERIFDAHASVVLAIAEILGEHDLAAERTGGLEDRGIPVVQSGPRSRRIYQ
jgi:hypothetical protein